MAALALGGCATATPEPPVATHPIKLDAAQLKAIERSVANGLKDPESARFNMITGVAGADGRVRACGYVNAKNSFGGYVGMRPFAGAFDGSNNFVFVLAEGVPQSADILGICKSRGILI